MPSGSDLTPTVRSPLGAILGQPIGTGLWIRSASFIKAWRDGSLSASLYNITRDLQLPFDFAAAARISALAPPPPKIAGFLAMWHRKLCGAHDNVSVPAPTFAVVFAWASRSVSRSVWPAGARSQCAPMSNVAISASRIHSIVPMDYSDLMYLPSKQTSSPCCSPQYPSSPRTCQSMALQRPLFGGRYLAKGMLPRTGRTTSAIRFFATGRQANRPMVWR